MWMLLTRLACLLCVFPSGVADAQNSRSVFPAVEWGKIDPQDVGWSVSKLEEARKYFETLPPASIVVVDRGRVVVEWGDPARRVKLSSIRKSLLSALYGIYVRKGRFDLDENLEHLGVDDDPPLTAQEKLATLRMLLEARSGVYHSYVGGSPNMKAEQPGRGSHAPGTFWYYNNWDFNTLGGIFERHLHSKIGIEFHDRIAIPIQMQDFRVDDIYYVRASSDPSSHDESIYPSYHFRLTARDLARFGYLYLRRGNWNGTQIVPADWVEESTRSHSTTNYGDGYGYLWWIDSFGLPEKNFSGWGSLGKFLVVIPERELVVAYPNHTEWPDDAPAMSVTELNKLPTISRSQMGQLLKLLLDAQRGKSNTGDHSP
jgi:CubicO group peptidase (beta-lactamase class C family)